MNKKESKVVVDDGVVAVFGQAAIDKAATAFRSAVSQYGKVSKSIRDMLSAMLADGRKPEDIEPDDRAEFIEAAGIASGVDYAPLASNGLISRIAKEMGFKMEKKTGSGSNVIKVNCKTATVKDIDKAVKQIIKAMVKNGAVKADVVKAIVDSVK